MRSRHLLQNGQKSCHLSVPVTINEQIPDCGESSCGRWQHAMERQMAILCRGGDGNHLPKIHACVQFLHTCASTLVHTHTGVRKVQMTMALFGAGRWRPLMDSLRATQDGTPCWEEIQMKEFGKYGNTRREIGIVSAPWKWTTSLLLSAMGKIQTRERWIPWLCVCLFELNRRRYRISPLIDLQTEEDKALEIPAIESWGLNSKFCLNTREQSVGWFSTKRWNSAKAADDQLPQTLSIGFHRHCPFTRVHCDCHHCRGIPGGGNMGWRQSSAYHYHIVVIIIIIKGGRFSKRVKSKK